MWLTLFDLDKTLIPFDTDDYWDAFLEKQGLIDKSTYQPQTIEFQKQYALGALNVEAYLKFKLGMLKGTKIQTLLNLREAFLPDISQLVSGKAKALVKEHQLRGDHTMIITVSHRFIAEPLANFFGVDHLIASEPEFCDGEFTGNFVGTPSYKQGKVIRLEEWFRASQKPRTHFESLRFYSDSHNDIPLLNYVDEAIAVDPDEKLHAYALSKNWKIISLQP